MTQIIDKIKQIPKLHCKNGCTQEQLDEAQRILGIQFSEEFKEYASKFGAISFYGTEWNGFNTAAYRDVVKATLEVRSLYPAFPGTMYIVEDLHIDGIMIASDSKGKIYQWYNGKIKKIYNTLSDYLDSCIARKNQ